MNGVIFRCNARCPADETRTLRPTRWPSVRLVSSRPIVAASGLPVAWRFLAKSSWPRTDLDLGRVAVVGHSAGGAVADLLGGSTVERRDLYCSASPELMLPLKVPQLIVHGTGNNAVPIELSRAYVCAAREAGDSIELAEMPECGHMEFLDATTAAQATLREWLGRQLFGGSLHAGT